MKQGQGDRAASHGAPVLHVQSSQGSQVSFLFEGKGGLRGRIWKVNVITCWMSSSLRYSTEERTKDVWKWIWCVMKGGMTALLKVGEGINSVWENDRLWKILKVNKICFYLMWWGDMRCREKKKDCFEWWAREVVTQWNSEGNREGWNCFLKERSCHQDMRRAWTGAEHSVIEKKEGCVREDRGGINVSHRLRLWRGGRRKGCRWHWLGLKEGLSLFSVTVICLALRNVLSSSNLQLPSPGVSLSTSWEILSERVDAEQLGRIVQPPLPPEAVLSNVNTLSRSQMSPGNKYWLLQHRPILKERDMDARIEDFSKCTKKLSWLKFTLCFSSSHTWCII